jgi:hypothetical protein
LYFILPRKVAMGEIRSVRNYNIGKEKGHNECGGARRLRGGEKKSGRLAIRIIAQLNFGPLV